MRSQRPPKGSRYTASTFPPSSSITRWSAATSPGGAAASSSAAASPVETPAGFFRLTAPAPFAFRGFLSGIGITYTRGGRRKRKAHGSAELAIGPLLSVAYALICYSRPGEPSCETSPVRHLSVRYVHGCARRDGCMHAHAAPYAARRRAERGPDR